MKYLIFLLPFLGFGQMSSGDDITDEALNALANDPGITIATDKPKIQAYKKELANDTLYIYYKKTWSTFGINGTCAVYNCQSDHIERTKYRIPFYIKNGYIVEGDEQYPKYEHKRIEKVEYEIIERW
ncbi:hypothetical protein [Robiginitalea biformata]|uniref:Uncharacterized protein n=1 Tax=Robiginitalea biformata (strain ATCC BAA-864 / DSM 15991 / KCTC 12146 / HTCC2501) TaxID=313596 RepID=A4CKP9_ROBBH|nr:hypothetical protein [Robiginitalea biformata]EAR15448.1 hypothetical protein RB2501_14009 [Robiginitalea biformata HTCC2501]